MSELSDEKWAALDARLKIVDEDRWLSSRYAPAPLRRGLIGLYMFVYELARVRLAVSEETLGQIRFHWWRDALAALKSGVNIPDHQTVSALAKFRALCPDSDTGLLAIIDRYEAAFLSKSRDQEPEDLIAALACQLLGGDFSDVSPETPSHLKAWAQARRGETTRALPPTSTGIIPDALRPALCHISLRRLYAKGKGDAPIARRLAVFRANLTGRY